MDSLQTKRGGNQNTKRMCVVEEQVPTFCFPDEADRSAGMSHDFVSLAAAEAGLAMRRGFGLDILHKLSSSPRGGAPAEAGRQLTVLLPTLCRSPSRGRCVALQMLHV